MKSTVGKVLLKQYLPTDLHGFIDVTPLDKKGIQSLVSKLATRDADVYKKALTGLTRLGFEVSTRQGSTVTLNDLMPPANKDKQFNDAEKKAQAIRRLKIPKIEQDRMITEMYQKLAENLNHQIIEEGVKSNKTLAKIVQSGSRGTATQYRQTIAGSVLVEDSKGNPMIDFPIRNSFAEGLSLPEYLASSFGARKNLISTKLGVSEGGFTNKQFSRASITTKVEEYDCGTLRGIPVSTSDKDYVGAYLAKASGGYARNNEVTLHMLENLKKKKIKDILVRSPITCEASKKFHFGALCSLCAGKREKGLPRIGDFVGITSASGLGESLSQSNLSAKHSGHIAGKSQLASGYPVINQFINPPKNFKDEAPLSDQDGIITDVRPSPAGGTIIKVNATEYYVAQGLKPKVKKGDKVEKGDVLSEGLVNPMKAVEYKGIGAGRKFYADNLKELFDNSGMNINKRNFDTIARSAIDSVQITDPNGLGDYLPDDIVSYNHIEKDYKTRPNSKTVRIDLALNKYLEEPVLHYSIGTRINSTVTAALRKAKIDSIVVNDHPPAFQPVMLRLLDIPESVPDFFHQMNSTYLQKRLLTSVNQGITSSVTGPSPITAIAMGAKI